MNQRAREIFVSIVVLTVFSLIYGQSADSVSYIPPQFRITNPWVAQPFDTEPVPLHFPLDTLKLPMGILSIPGLTNVRAILFAKDWSVVQISQTVNGVSYAVPFIATADWYFTHRLQQNLITEFAERVNLHEFGKTGQKQAGHGKSLEVVGVDLGGLGRASLRVNGNVSISGKAVFQNQNSIQSTYNQSQNTHIEFDQKQNLGIEGKIGDRITVKLDQDSERDFNWENNIRISYKGDEDDIIQQVDAGNISLSLPATQYVTFSGSNKGLFGLKAVSKFGPVDVTTIASIEQTQKQKQSYTGGSASNTQQIKDYNYVKNRYFFVHPWFRNGVLSDSVTTVPVSTSFMIYPFYPLYKGSHRILNSQDAHRVVIKNFELYKRDVTNDPSALEGTAYVDPNRPDFKSEENLNGTFVRLEIDTDYSLNQDLGYIRMNTQVSNDIVGCTFDLVNTQGDTVFSVGHRASGTDTTLALLLLKTANPHPSDPNWNLMFQNVYDLGASNINPDGFAVRIVNNLVTPESDRNKKGVAYLTLFGLDSTDNSGQTQSDELIDMDNYSILNVVTGELIFPTYFPFVSTDSIAGGNPDPELTVDLTNGAMYTTTNTTDINNSSVFTIEADYTNQSSTINLGFMLVDGSEELRANGDLLQRGTDYQIDYFTGTINLISEKAKDPNAKLEILYEKHELVSFDKKVILGTRAQMDFGKNSFLGATALYFNQSVVNQKIDVGYEPTRNFIWDVNGRYAHDLNGLTRFLDRLPIVETEKPSSFSVEGEIAQVMPNPNSLNNKSTGDPNGVAYIDDFEGVKRTTSPTILQRSWKPSSAPLNPFTLRPYSQLNRARMYYYNPYGQVATTDIWPNQSTSLRAQNELTDIMILHQTVRPQQAGVDPDSVWSGITTTLYSGDYDQTQSKFLEIWVKGTQGNLEVDLGKVSEDWNGDGKLNTEDKPSGGLNYGNGLLDENEDTGLDGCFDEYENGWGGCLTGDSTYADYLEYYQETGNPVPINMASDVDPNDPNDDNWSFSTSKLDYHKTNGTEGNGSGNTIQEGGRYPDTEDLDHTNTFETQNDYFYKKFALNDTTYLAGITEKDGKPTGWRLFRVPLSHFIPTSNIGWNEIQNIRLIWTGVDSVAYLEIAKIELVGNDWLELGVANDSSHTYTKDDSVFAIAVTNTEDNADYTPPTGVQGEYDQVNQVRAKEQSLVLKFDNLGPYKKVAAQKALLSLSGDRAKSYLTYDRMKMFVYGSSPGITTDQTDVHFFLKFGLDEKNYYEIRQPVYQGWDQTENRNSIDIDLNWLTRLKLRDSTNIDPLKYNPNDVFYDSSGTLIYQFADANGQLTQKVVMIKGQPSLNRIKNITVGLINVSSGEITGEVWLDELRLSGVKKDKGIAMRVKGKLDMADLGSTTIQYARKDADFHVLQDRLGTNQTNSALNVNSNFQMDKFLPSFLGLKIPVNTSFSNSVNQPKYFPGTDILVDKSNVPDSILAKSTNVSLSTSISKASHSDHKLIKYTLDNLKGNFSASRKISSNNQTLENRNETYSGGLTYSLRFGKDSFIKPFRWAGFLPWIGDPLSEIQFYYLPSSFSTGMKLNEGLNSNTPRVGDRTDKYSFGLNRDLGISYNLTDNINSGYKHSIKSDLQEYRGYAWMALRDLSPGIVTNENESLNLGWTPEFLKIFNPNFNYSAAYAWNESLGDRLKDYGARIGTNLQFSSGFSISPRSIVELFYKPASANKNPGGHRRRGALNKPSEEPKPELKKNRPVLKFLHNMSSKISPISINYKQGLNRTGNGVLGQVPTGYKFGWLPEHGQPISPSVGTNTGDWSFNRDFSINSGIKPGARVSINFNYAQNIAANRNGVGLDKRSLSRSYLGTSKTLENGFPFPGWSVRITGLEKLPIINKLVQTATLEHSYSGKQSMEWKFENQKVDRIPFFSPGIFIDQHGDFQTQSKISQSFSPLVGLSFTLVKNISLTIRNTQDISVDVRDAGITKRIQGTWSASSSYNHRGGFTIPIPFMKDFHIQNNMNFTLNYDANNDASYSTTKESNKLTITAKSSLWKIGLRVQYSFTSKVNGGLRYEYRETSNVNTGRKIDRDFGFDLNLAISG